MTRGGTNTDDVATYLARQQQAMRRLAAERVARRRHLPSGEDVDAGAREPDPFLYDLLCSPDAAPVPGVHDFLVRCGRCGHCLVRLYCRRPANMPGADYYDLLTAEGERRQRVVMICHRCKVPHRVNWRKLRETADTAIRAGLDNCVIGDGRHRRLTGR